MWTSILSVIAYLVPFLLDAWKESRPEAVYAKTNQGRLDIANGNTDAINLRVDRMLPVGNMPTERNKATGDPQGQCSDASITERLNNVLNS